jgi:hypothetical protein
MHTIKIFFLSLFLVFVSFSSYAQTNDLYKEIVRLDSILFDAYNNCDIAKQAELYSDSIEFYHDKGGLNTSKEDILESIKKNVCGKVTRELVPGSIEVSPIPGYGAVELGMHMFHNNEEKDQVPHPSRFVIIWKKTNEKWIITRIISLH